MEIGSSAVFELAQMAQTPAGSGNGPAGDATVSSFDVANFKNAFESHGGSSAGQAQGEAQNAQAVDNAGSSLRSMFDPLVRLNDQASHVRGESFEQIASSGDLSPSDMMKLSVEVHKFSFQSQLTSNIADKSSRGVQQLFRQKA